jgi:hypothetical protein
MDVAAWLQSLGLERYEPDGQPGDLAKNGGEISHASL